MTLTQLGFCILCHLGTALVLAWTAHQIKSDLRAWLEYCDTHVLIVVVYAPGDASPAGERLKWATRYEILAGGIVVATAIWGVKGYYVIRARRQ